MQRNLKAFFRGEPKWRGEDGADPRLLSNAALCEIYDVLDRERQRLLPMWSEGAGDITDSLVEIVSILSERVHDCIAAEFAPFSECADDGQEESE